jgi:hypothetical protein
MGTNDAASFFEMHSLYPSHRNEIFLIFFQSNFISTKEISIGCRMHAT